MMIRAIRKRSGYIVAFFLMIVFIGLVYYFGIYDRMEEEKEALLLSIAEAEESINLEKDKEKKIHSMQELIAAEAKSGSQVYEYNNEGNELDYLSELMGKAINYDLSFSEPYIYGESYVRRPVSLNYNAEDFDTSVEIIRGIINCPCRTIIKDLIISPYGSTSEDSILDRSLSGKSRVSVSAEVIFVEFIGENTDTRGLYD